LWAPYLLVILHIQRYKKCSQWIFTCW